MRIIEIETMDGLMALRSAWNNLLRRSAADTLFLTWEWMAAWWASYGTEGELKLMLAVDEHDELCGIAPLRRKQVRRVGQSTKALMFMGDGSNDSEYLDLIVDSNRETEVREALRAKLERECDAGHVLLLNEIPAESPTLPYLWQMGCSTRFLWTSKQTACATTHLPASWDEYLAMLKPRFRTKVRSVLRTIEARSDVRFGVCTSQSDLDRLLPVLFDLHARRWATEGKPGVFGWDQKRAFYRDLSARLLDAGWLHLTWFEWKDRILACQYGFLYNGVYLHLQEGYEPACEHWNSGIALRAWSIRKLIGEGVTEYDFLGGINRHKTDWGAVEKSSTNIQLARASIGNRWFLDGPGWVAQARETVATLMPERVLELRRSWLSRTRPVAAPPDKLKQVAANVYLHSGLPTIIRGIRERYQLAMPEMRLRKRSEPAGRILYYHRVNAKDDPFYPAISTQLFEEEMRYLARNHKVVSLAELQRRLRDGVEGDVVAITFDDGYADNFTEAFPVLERYGLPATIFLTTGPIDSGATMWFESLAGALKHTEQESIDLEIDVPRRHLLRNEAERLRANDEIYGVLRRMPERDRAEWMRHILKVLGAGPQGSKMLTWDQVRHMKARGIDFGGHTVNHPFLSRLPEDGVFHEVSECKRRIEEELQQPVLHFAYPSGREEDFGSWNKAVVRRAGYEAAVTTIWGLNYRTTDPMEMRRGGPWETTAGMFASKLDWYQLVND